VLIPREPVPEHAAPHIVGSTMTPRGSHPNLGNINEKAHHTHRIIGERPRCRLVRKLYMVENRSSHPPHIRLSWKGRLRPLGFDPGQRRMK
jgi:hypothetical protein